MFTIVINEMCHFWFVEEIFSVPNLFFFNDTVTTEIYTLSLHDALPIFAYNATEPTEITEVSSQLFVDVNPGRDPSEVSLQTAVFLRNQNRAPTAEFEWAPMPETNIFLNASASVDPEEKSLAFEWFDLTANKSAGEGIVLTYKAPAPGPREMRLTVRDATLFTTNTQTICATGPGETCP